MIVCTLILPENLPLMALLDIVLLVSKSSSCRTRSCAPSHTVSLSRNNLDSEIAYENKTAHHVHGGANAGEEGRFVGGNHPLAAGLHISTLASPLLCHLHALNPAIMRNSFGQSFSRVEFVASTSYPPASSRNPPNSKMTHLLPRPQAIVLLELALVVRNAVLTENPAASRQYRALCGKPEWCSASGRATGDAVGKSW